MRTYTCSVCGAHGTEEFSLADAIRDTAGRIFDKIREWIEKIFGGGGGSVIPDDPDTPDDQVIPGDPDDSGEVPEELTLDVTLYKTTFTYNGKVQLPKIKSVKMGDIDVEDYDVEYSDPESKDAGDYTVTVSTGDEAVRISGAAGYSIVKAANPISVNGKTATVKYKKLKKKAQTVSAASVMSVWNAKGKVTYSLSSVSKAKYRKYFSVNASNGNVTIRKKLRRGTYTLTVRVNAAGDNNYNAGARNAVYRIRVR